MRNLPLSATILVLALTAILSIPIVWYATPVEDSAQQTATADQSASGTRASPTVSLNMQGEIDLSTQAQFDIIGKKGGSPSGDGLGQYAVFGDINGDGKEDLLISAKYAPMNTSVTPNVLGPGEVYVFYNKPRQDFASVIDLASTTPDLIIRGENSSDEFGASIAIANVNGDGYNDIIIGAPGYGLPAIGPLIYRQNIGATYVIFGNTKANLGTFRDMTIPGQRGVLIRGEKDAEYSGTSVCAGDIDNDGYDDIVVGTPQMVRFIWDGAIWKPDMTGGVYVHWGRASWPSLIECNYTWCAPGSEHFGVKILGKALGDVMGKCVVMADINNDTYSDIIIGAPAADGWNDSIPSAGEVYVVCGNKRAQFPHNATIENMANLTLMAKDMDDAFGTALGTGNVDGDEYLDILMSSPSADGPSEQRSNCGEACLFYGNSYIANGLSKAGTPVASKAYNITQKTDVLITGAGFGDNLGAFAGLKDIDGDGLADIMLAATNGDGRSDAVQDSGEAYVIYGHQRLGMQASYDIAQGAEDLVIYGAGMSDMLGSCMACGDLDGDSVGDLVLGAMAADGPSNMRKSCGEAYGIFGCPFRTTGFYLKDGYDINTHATSGGTTVFAGYKAYEFVCNVSSAKGVSDLDDVSISFDPAVSNCTLQWTQSTGQFDVTNNSKGYITLDGANSSATVSGTKICLRIKLKFSWDFYTEVLRDVRVWARNDTGISTFTTYSKVLRVENDLTYQGVLYVESSEFSDVSVNGSWCPSTGVLNWTGLRVIYEGSQSVYPPNSAFKSVVRNATQAWEDTQSSGRDILITTPAPQRTGSLLGLYYTVGIEGMNDSAEDHSNIGLYLRADKTPPQSPVNLTLHADSFIGPSAQYDNDREIYVTWDPVQDMTHESGTQGGMGVKAYYYSFDDRGGTSNGTQAWGSGGLTGYYYNTLNFCDLKYVQTDPTIDFDWGGWSPDANTQLAQDNFTVRWVGRLYTNYSTTYTFYIDSDDGGEIWLDGKIIYNEWKPAHPMQAILYLAQGYHDIRIDYGDASGDAKMVFEWAYQAVAKETVPACNLFHPTTSIVIPDAPAEASNVYVWAEDLLGNIGQASAAQIFIDIKNATFSDPIMKTSQWLTNSTVKVGLTVSDIGSGVDVASLQQRISSTDTGDYGDWQSLPQGACQVISPDEVNISYDLELQEGALNYIQWRAKDMVGNGYAESAGYNLWVDTVSPDVEIRLPAAQATYRPGSVYLNASIIDSLGSGIAAGSVSYRLSSNGTSGYGAWQDVGPINLTLTANLRYASFNISLDLPEGEYYVQVRAKDVAGNPYATSPDVGFIVAQVVVNDPPVPIISSPNNGDTFYQVDNIFFDASNSTDELPTGQLKFYWHSSWDGALGTGPKLWLNRSYHLGNHVIELFVSDGKYNVSVKVTITIVVAPNPNGPVNPADPDPANDTDDDNMLDSWELRYFGDLATSDGTQDHDSDGYSDRLEYLYNVSPVDKDSKPPAGVAQDMKESPAEKTQWGLYITVAIVALALIVIAILGFMLYRRQKQREAVSDEIVLMMRQKTTSDKDYDSKKTEDEDALEAEGRIRRKSRDELEEEAEGLYGDTEGTEEDVTEDADEEEEDEEEEEEEDEDEEEDGTGANEEEDEAEEDAEGSHGSEETQDADSEDGAKDNVDDQLDTKGPEEEDGGEDDTEDTEDASEDDAPPGSHPGSGKPSKPSRQPMSKQPAKTKLKSKK